MPNKMVKLNRNRATLSPNLCTEVCSLLVDLADKTATRLNNEIYYPTLYRECIYLYMHILSRLVFHEFGGLQRDQFIRQCMDQLIQLLEGQFDSDQLVEEIQYREHYYCRYPCLEEHSTDIGFIAHGFNRLLLDNNLPAQLVTRATMLINDGCLLWLRRLATHQLRLHTDPLL
ncbi:MAG: hypothetical protein ACM3NT_09055 [Methylocystaceae bacterium]